MLVGAWIVFSAALVGLGWLSLGTVRRQLLHWRVDRRRAERREWREPPDRRYRR